MMGIDPQLVDTPATSRAMSDFGDDEGEADNEDSPNGETREKLTLTIAPVKVGGHGKARKGTVQSGGVVKKVSGGAAVKDKENTGTSVPKSSKVSVKPGSGDADDDDDDLPGDWRPSPEVFQKMTSKEKRQLRNKISARNFRVRRKGAFLSFFLHLPSHAL
jgi:bZIP-type transcription factor MBZ1